MEQQEQQEQLEQLCQRLAADRPSQWDALPDIPLYMDQVVSYLGRQLISFSESDRLTSAMINNYIKDGLVPRANGKKYDREHLAYLTVVSAVKQVLSVRDIGTLLSAVSQPIQARETYEDFCAQLDQALQGTLEQIRSAPDQQDLPALALTLALRSYADALACRRIVSILRPEPEKGGKRKKHKGEEPAP